MAEQRFLRPLDVLYLRGNRLFGEAGAHSEAEIPPWPTVAAGALRSRMLADAGLSDFAAFAAGRAALPEPYGTVLGSPDEPGSFRIAAFLPAWKGDSRPEPLLPLPADLLVFEEEGVRSAHRLDLSPTKEELAADGLVTSHPGPKLPTLRVGGAGKSKSGFWLGREALSSYLRGAVPDPDALVAEGALWQRDLRLGIALDRGRRTVREGALYTSEVIAVDPETGFFVAVAGADGCVPESGLLRFGGDGRAVAVERAGLEWPPEPDWTRIERERRFLFVLQTPGLFEEGWKPPRLLEDGKWTGPKGLEARLATAVVPRARVVSGWDLARGKPKVAQRVVPAGAVYAFDDARGPLRDGLSELLREGFWPLLPESGIWAQRRAEGFNNLLVANWPRTDD